MTQPIALALIVLLASPLRASSLDAHKVAYVGGTIPWYDVANEPLDGHLHMDPTQVTFVPDRRPRVAEHLSIDYSSIRGLEFGQTVGRRVPLVVGALVVLGPFGLPSLSARHRAHYLTLLYADPQDQYQVVVMELGKDIVRATLRTLEERSGVAVEYQDDEARKWSR